MGSRTTIESVRAFNRFYTRVLGLLDRYFLQSPYALTEVRVLYEIAQGGLCTAKSIRAEIGIDAGYLSRILDSFVRGRLVRRTSAAEDRRYQVLELTKKGKDVFARLTTSQDSSVEALVEKLSGEDRKELVVHMQRIQELIGRR
jgi:DNA-binding MarR family transcriptional regulator